MRDIVPILAASGKVPMEEINQAFDLFGERGDELWRNLVANGYITEEEVFKAVAKYTDIEFLDISGLDIPAQVVNLLPPEFCRREKVLPIRTRGDDLFLATSDPQNFTAIDDAAALSNLKINPKVVTPTLLQSTIDRYLRSDEELGRLTEALGGDTTVVVEDDGIEDLSSADDEEPIVRFVNLLISQAIRDRASDIHVEPGSKELLVRFRIDGVLKEMQKADKNIQAGIISRLKIMASIDIAEKRRPQDGRMTVNSAAGTSVDIRVASLPTVWGEKIIMRILDHSGGKRSLESMGMSERDLTVFRNAIGKPHGMVLVTGPTGSGKSTSLYTTLDEVANSTVNVITVEDPVEKRIEGVNQVQINNKAGLNFPAALRSILRSDPDIVLIGEIRDKETATISVEASLTGHLVLSTLHTNGAPEAMTRLIEMGVEPYLVATSISCVVAQRLARKLCEKCKVEMPVNESLMKKIEFPKVNGEWPKVYNHVGCSECSDTGYRGRLPIVEVMNVNEEIQRLTVDQVPSSALRKIAEADGFTSLREDGWRRVSQGLTTIEEVLRVTA